MTQYTALNARAAGDLDSGFGENHDGKVVLSFPNTKDTCGECIAEGPDGRIYVGGGVDAQGDDLIHKLGVACLRNDGTPDISFGKDGFVIVRFEPMQDTHLRQIHFLQINGQPRILLSGVDTKKGENVLARLHADGRPDNAFGVEGRLTVRLPSNLADSLGLGTTQVTTTSVGNAGPCVLADGKIYVVTEVYMPIWIATVAVLIRLNDDGSLDTSFNRTGYVAVTNQHWGNSMITDVLVQNGKITVCGMLKGNGMVARLNDDGSFDKTFAAEGFKLFDSPLFAFEKLAPYSKTGVLAAGWGMSPRRGVLACLTEKGELEPGFNNAQVLFQSFGEGTNVLLYGVGMVNGAIIASGRLTGNSPYPEFVVARYRSNGTLDPDFGHGKGWSSAQFEGHYTVANAMALQKDGNVLVLGDSYHFSTAALIARFLNTAQS